MAASGKGRRMLDNSRNTVGMVTACLSQRAKPCLVCRNQPNHGLSYWAAGLAMAVPLHVNLVGVHIAWARNLQLFAWISSVATFRTVPHNHEVLALDCRTCTSRPLLVIDSRSNSSSGSRRTSSVAGWMVKWSWGCFSDS